MTERTDATHTHRREMEGLKKLIQIREHNIRVIERYISMYSCRIEWDRKEKLMRHLRQVRSSVSEMKAEYILRYQYMNKDVH